VVEVVVEEERCVIELDAEPDAAEGSTSQHAS
jgi:hypothetical protein